MAASHEVVEAIPRPLPRADDTIGPFDKGYTSISERFPGKDGVVLDEVVNKLYRIHSGLSAPWFTTEGRAHH
jgi:hypothetical protein